MAYNLKKSFIVLEVHMYNDTPKIKSFAVCFRNKKFYLKR